MTRATGRTNQRVGAAGEEQGAAALARMGVLLLEKVATPIRRIPHPTLPQYCRVIYDKPVSCDWHGVWVDGVSVRAEIKTHMDGNLTWSAFQPHQPAALTAHAEIAISFLVWVSGAGIFVMRWPLPVEVFAPGKGLAVEQARKLDVQ